MEKMLRLNRTISASVTRPANTTAYSAGQVLANSTTAGTVVTFAQATKDTNGQAVINEAICIDEANQATKPDLELWLFDTAPAAENDAAAFAPTSADLENLVAVIAFPVASFKVANAGSGVSGNVVCDQQNLGIPINTKTGLNALYGIVVVRNAYTPISAEKFVFKVKVLD